MNKRMSGLFSIVVSVAALLVVFYAGRITTLFNTNMCYSEIITDIKSKAFSANSSNELVQLQALLLNLPLNGYESNCSEIREVVIAYNKSLNQDATTVAPIS